MKGQVADRGQGRYLIYGLPWWWQEPGENGGDGDILSLSLVFVYPPTFHPFLIFSVFLSFPCLCPFTSLTSSWNLSLSRPSLSPHPLPLFHSFPIINLWLSKPVFSSGGLAPGWKRDERLALFHHRGVRVNLFFFFPHFMPTLRTVSLCLPNDFVLHFLAAVASGSIKRTF